MIMFPASVANMVKWMLIRVVITVMIIMMTDGNDGYVNIVTIIVNITVSSVISSNIFLSLLCNAAITLRLDVNQ